MLNNSFKPIPGYSDYLINENGDIFSKKSNKLLKPRESKNGYLYVILYKNGKPKTITIHKLVAMTHLDNPNNLPQVNHIDGNKLNNHISNLEFCTAAYNTKHAWENGLCESIREASRKNGKKAGKINCKYAQEANIRHLTPDLKELFDDIFIRKLKTKDIAKKFNFSETYINRIKNKQKLQVAISEYQKSNLFDIWDKIL